MDHFEKKRGMVKTLLDALKKSAGDEMNMAHSKGLPQTTPPGPKVEAGHGVSPDLHKSAKMEQGGHPHMVDLTPTDSLQQKTSDSSMMAEGGLAGTDMDASDEPNRLTEPKGPMDSNQDETALGLLPEPPQDEQGQEEERQTLANENMEHEDEDNNSSSFEAFMPRKKKK